MFAEIWGESFLAKKVRRFWSLAAGLGAMMIVAGVLAFVPIMQASAVPPPPLPSPPGAPPVQPTSLAVAGMKMKSLPHVKAGFGPARAVPVYYRPRSL